MLKKVSSYIAENQLLSLDSPVLVGVSGGADSVTLLHILFSLGYNCIVAHCNFHLRGAESDRDENFVVDFAAKYQIPLYKIDFDTVGYAAKQGISIEMAARDLRYNWFRELLNKTGAQAVAVAHHADDNIETMLLNLIRGTGLRGLTGIPCKNGEVVRPLLCCSRAEVDFYITDNGLDHVEDSTNVQCDYKRNKIRHRVIPLLEEINPSIRQTLYDSVMRFNDTYVLFQSVMDEMKKKLITKKENTVFIDVNLLKQQPAVETVLFEILQPYGFTGSVVQQIVKNLDGISGKLFFSDKYCLVKDRNELILTEKNAGVENDYYIYENDVLIQEPIKMSLRKLEKTEHFQVSKNKDIVHFDFSKLQFPLILRKWRNGDVFHPFGMKGQKKVSDFFIDVKLSLIEKEACWLLCSENEIVWIVGYRTDDRFRVTTDTKIVLEIKV